MSKGQNRKPFASIHNDDDDDDFVEESNGGQVKKDKRRVLFSCFIFLYTNFRRSGNVILSVI
jgi:hypothetical protein